MVKAWLVGLAVLICAYPFWEIVWKWDPHPVLTGILVVFPLIAAFLTAYLAPQRKFLLGMSMSLCNAIMATACNTIHQLLGFPSDLPGLEGAKIGFLVVLILDSILCLIGALSGQFAAWYVSKKMKN